MYFEMVALACRPVKCSVFRHKHPKHFVKQIFILLNYLELLIGLLSDIKPLNNCPLTNGFFF